MNKTKRHLGDHARRDDSKNNVGDKVDHLGGLRERVVNHGQDVAQARQHLCLRLGRV